MSERESARRPATFEDLLAIPEDERFHELIDGEIVEKTAPSGEHANAEGAVLGAVRPAFHRRSGGGGLPGGWWILIEVDVQLGRDIVRPDIAGWRRDTCPEPPSGFPVQPRPDWVCEIVSPAKPQRDTVKKVRLYHAAQVPYYWLVDPKLATLTVMHWRDDGYLTLLVAERGETVRARPFDAIEIAVGTLLGDDPP